LRRLCDLILTRDNTTATMLCLEEHHVLEILLFIHEIVRYSFGESGTQKTDIRGAGFIIWLLFYNSWRQNHRLCLRRVLQ
jgi:hypothetical protein